MISFLLKRGENMRSKKQVLEIVRLLEEEYPLAECTLDYKKDYELLFSVRLAAQCTDARVNMITPALFERFPTLCKALPMPRSGKWRNMSAPAAFTGQRRATSLPVQKCSLITTAAKYPTAWRNY